MLAQSATRKYQINGFIPSTYTSRLVPVNVSRQYEIVPLRLIDNRLLAAAAYPLSRQTITNIQRNIQYPLDIIQTNIMDIRTLRGILYQIDSEMPKAVPVELALTKTGLISEDQLAAAKSLQAENDRDLAAIALEKHWINESQWGEVVGLSHQIPHLRPQTASPLDGIEILLPLSHSEQLGVLPLWWVGSSLYLTVSDSKALNSLSNLRNLDYKNRAVVCDAFTYQRLKKIIYRPNISMGQVVSENNIADLLVFNRIIGSDEMEMAYEIQRRTGIGLSRILEGEYGISSEIWLDAKAELLDMIAIHPQDLPGDIEERIRSLLPLIPEILMLQYDLLPLFLESDVLVVALPEPQPKLLSLISAITGYQVEMRLMDKTLIHSLMAAFQDTILRGDGDFDRHVKSVDLSDFLLSSGLLQRDQIRNILSDEKSDIADLPERLLGANLLNEQDLAEVYSLMSGIPWLTLEYFQYDMDLINSIPSYAALENKIFPLFEYKGDLWVAVSDLYSCDFLGEIEQLTKRRVWPVIVPRTSLLSALNRYYQFSELYSNAETTFKVVDLLVEGGLITQAEAFEVVNATVDQHIPFDQAVLNLEGVSTEEFYQYLAKKLEAEYVNIGMVENVEKSFDSLGQLQTYRHWKESIDVNAARLIDLNTAKRLTAIPISKTRQGLKVAFADPLFEGNLQEISLLLNQKVIPCLASRDEINAAIQRVLGQVNLGTSLLMAGRITLSQLNNALTLSQNTNVRLGRALVHRGFITEQALYQFLAHQAQLPLFELSDVQLDEEAAHLLDVDEERRLGILPLAADDDSVYLAMVDPLNREGLLLAEKETGRKVHPILVTERDFDEAMEKLYQDDYLARSISQLLNRTPEDSAFRVFSRGQIVAGILALIISAAWLIWDYMNFIVVINSLFSVFYLLFSVYKANIIFKTVSTDLEVELTDEDIKALNDRDLPVYTILVPVYREANVLPEILSCLSNMDYPNTKLDIKILMEANDRETIDAFYLANPPDFIHAVVVPDAQPKTKPKACNYGLIHARGEYLVIYDAEDLPDRDQLKRSVAAFKKVPADVVCIQAKLNYYNRTQNVLTQWFTSEYSMWFDLLLPGLDATRAPIPLGGTSNHFKTFALIEVGAWDPYNVTEDADLGIRLYKRGYRTRIMESTTYEEANSRIGNWIRQRSRWVKGYMQTWLVHMRKPVKLLRELGPRAFASFNLLVGGTFFVLLLNPFYWVMTTAWYFYNWDLIEMIYPGSVFYIGAICLYVGNFVFTYANVAGAMRRKYYDMVRITLFSPAYWGLMSVGAWKGLLQLLVKPHFWEKTIHGLSKNEAQGTPDV